MNPTIRIFACDHRHGVDWNLPFIRFGGQESDCAIKCQNFIFDRVVRPDETPKLFWLWYNLQDFGCDYIGYCQYRRFFTSAQVNGPLLNIKAEQLDRDYILTPEQQLQAILMSKANGILHPAFDVLDKTKTPFTYIWEQIELLTREDILPKGWPQRAFEIFLECTPQTLKAKMEESFKESTNYLCNIFTCKTELFRLFGEIAFPAAKQLLEELDRAGVDQKKMHPYWLAYVFERYTSCFFHCLEASGLQFTKFPLMTIDAGKHIKWEKPNA